MNLLLERFAYSPDGTFGKLYVGDDAFWTVELPWEGNAKGRSCIPEGNYTLSLRQSQVVTDSTDGEFIEGWEVTNVRGRTYVMIHPANWPSELKGCIAPGDSYTIINNANAVTNSRDSFRKLMALLDGEESHSLTIRQYSPQYP